MPLLYPYFSAHTLLGTFFRLRCCAMFFTFTLLVQFFRLSWCDTFHLPFWRNSFRLPCCASFSLGYPTLLGRFFLLAVLRNFFHLPCWGNIFRLPLPCLPCCVLIFLCIS